MFSQVNGAGFWDFQQKVLQFYCETQRFQSADPTFHFIDFSLGKTNISATPESRSGNTMFSQVNGAELRDFQQKVLHFYCETQRFRNAIPTSNFIDFSLGKTNIPASPK